MHIEKLNIRGNPNVGLFGVVTDNYAIVSPDLAEEAKNLAKKIHTLTLAGTDLVGLFAAGNKNGLLIPYTANRRELAAIEVLKKELGINILQLKMKETALGNLVCANDKGAMVSGLLAEQLKPIEDTLGVETATAHLMGMEIPGSYCAATNKGFLLSMLAEEEDFNTAHSILKVEGDIGSINFGSPFVKSGLLANSKGVIVGSQTTGHEMARIDEALGFLGEK